MLYLYNNISILNIFLQNLFDYLII